MPAVRSLIFLCLLLASVRAADVGLIRVGEPWRFWKGTTEPAPQSVAWAGLEYNDTNWLTSISGFSAGYGDISSEATKLPDYGAAYRTIYFRKHFNVPDTNRIAELILRIDYDDGFVAYLNGLEVARRGLAGAPGDPVGTNAIATYHSRGATEEISLLRFPEAIRTGTNVLAIQVVGSGGLDYTACLAVELLANILRGPFVQNTTPSSMQIAWKTLSSAGAAVEFGTDLERIGQLENRGTETNHVVTLTNLIADTEYFYRVINRFGSRNATSDWRTFKTFKSTGTVRFHVLGDSGWASLGQYQLAALMRTDPVDFVMHLGDINYYAFTHHNADLRCFSVYAEQMRSVPWFVALGNHDLYLDRQAAIDSFYLPTNSVTGTEHYYSFDQGDAHFVVVWSDLQAGADYRPESAQYTWVDNDLATTTKPWKFMIFHHTWRTSSIHSQDDYDYNRVPDSQQLDASFVALARKHGVQIIFNGHDHAYERLAPSGGPISFVSGGGGAVLYPLWRVHPDTSQFFSRYEFLRVQVGSEETLVEAVGVDGKVFDKVHVRRTFPAREAVPASWNAPVIAPRTDPTGNTFGEAFDFTGSPLNAPMGLFTSPGRMFVNNDRENLYVGFDEVMLRAGEELFLFIESATLPGITNMQALGNGVMDPAGEGADSLDFLENLTFENFAPAIAVLLGDELGDFPAKDFARSGPAVGSGQGAFYLTNGFPTVPGQRLAQFNRSPQDFTAFYETNSDYVEIAIPFSALGGLRPGDRIRVAAITALAAMSTNDQARLLDTGAIGYSVRRTNSPADGMVLEGIEVILAADPDPDSDGLTNAEEAEEGTNPHDADTDDDGLLDGWEVQYGFNPLDNAGNEGNLDMDADGLTNLQEAAAKTNPKSADTDGDGLPDGWEVAHGLDGSRGDAADGAGGDPDGDRLNNASEYRAGTHPRDPQSSLGVRGIDATANALRLTWSAVPGKRYKVQFRDKMTEAFQDVVDPAFPKTAQAAEESFTLQFSPEISPRARYYRVRLVE